MGGELIGQRDGLKARLNAGRKLRGRGMGGLHNAANLAAKKKMSSKLKYDESGFAPDDSRTLPPTATFLQLTKTHGDLLEAWDTR